MRRQIAGLWRVRTCHAVALQNPEVVQITRELSVRRTSLQKMNETSVTINQLRRDGYKLLLKPHGPLWVSPPFALLPPDSIAFNPGVAERLKPQLQPRLALSVHILGPIGQICPVAGTRIAVHDEVGEVRVQLLANLGILDATSAFSFNPSVLGVSGVWNASPVWESVVDSEVQLVNGHTGVRHPDCGFLASAGVHVVRECCRDAVVLSRVRAVSVWRPVAFGVVGGIRVQCL